MTTKTQTKEFPCDRVARPSTAMLAIVTGSGRGLGLAYAAELARQGASVVVNDVDEQTVAEAVASIEASADKWSRSW